MAANGQLAILAEGCTLKGELCVTGDILVAGRVEGTIICQGSISIGVSGVVCGTVHGCELVVSGRVEGDVNVNVVEILGGGRIDGNIQAEQLIIERSGIFSGTSSTIPGKKNTSLQLEVRQPALIEH